MFSECPIDIGAIKYIDVLGVLLYLIEFKLKDENDNENENVEGEEEMNDEADKEIKLWYAPVHSNEYYQEHLKMKKEKKCLIF